jgi:Plasmid pRiA4b ORF-3-like protein
MPASRPLIRVNLTQAQRKAVALLLPDLTERLKLNEKNQRTIPFSQETAKEVSRKAAVAIRQARSGMVRNSLRCVIDLIAQAIEDSQGIGAIPASERLFQFEITLRDIQPPIWRRIQVKDGTLDKLHEHIQTAMGWTNSHLHRFKIGDKEYGDPDLLFDDVEPWDFEDSTSTKISEALPRSGKRFLFEYEYDFGDSWQHDVLFEGCVQAERGKRYPVCLEGARHCPPEDVGGTPGYEEFLEAIADPEHERHEEFLRWAGGRFDPEEFAAEKMTKKMRRGLPDWRRMSEDWI